ncbi:hypothetical protein CC2G_009904 [Coprinopsis cinerea AmutBmut pab1-1]|nr:hypothetical protein CC2G_009904 [Coprinopsis cinerea AmutBmut pab1-1]
MAHLILIHHLVSLYNHVRYMARRLRGILGKVGGATRRAMLPFPRAPLPWVPGLKTPESLTRLLRVEPKHVKSEVVRWIWRS